MPKALRHQSERNARSQALLDLDLARELIELAGDYRVYAGITPSLHCIPMPNGEQAIMGHRRALDDAQMIIDEVRRRALIQSFYNDPRN